MAEKVIGFNDIHICTEIVAHKHPGRVLTISLATLVIHGTNDPIIPYEHGVHLSKIISNAVLVTLDGAGHELHHNDWDEIINAISKHAAKSINEI